MARGRGHYKLNFDAVISEAGGSNGAVLSAYCSFCCISVGAFHIN